MKYFILSIKGKRRNTHRLAITIAMSVSNSFALVLKKTSGSTIPQPLSTIKKILKTSLKNSSKTPRYL
jgi:hypothetical protein